MHNRKIIFLFLNHNICCGYSKEQSQWDGSFEHPNHMLNIMGKKIFTILRWNFLFILTCELHVVPKFCVLARTVSKRATVLAHLPMYVYWLISEHTSSYFLACMIRFTYQLSQLGLMPHLYLMELFVALCPIPLSLCAEHSGSVGRMLDWSLKGC